MINLLLVFALTFLSLIEARKNDSRLAFSRIQANEEFQLNVLYFNHGSINDQGHLVQNYTGRSIDTFFQYDKVPISQHNPYKKGTSITDASFLTIPKKEIPTLKATQTLNSSEQECNPVLDFQYQLINAWLGYTIKALKGVDIQPSDTYLMKNYPTKKIVISPEGVAHEDDLPAPTCDDYIDSNYFYIIHKYGVVGTDCFPNTVVPSRTDKCTQGGGKYQKFLQGYSEAEFETDVDGFKEALIKFGPVYQEIVVIGWEGNNWVTVELSQTTGGLVLGTYPIDPDQEMPGFVLAKYEADPGTQICTGKNQPSSECVCPEVASGSYTKAKCEKDKAVILGSSGSFHIALQMIASAVVLPILALFF